MVKVKKIEGKGFRCSP